MPAIFCLYFYGKLQMNPIVLFHLFRYLLPARLPYSIVMPMAKVQMSSIPLLKFSNIFYLHASRILSLFLWQNFRLDLFFVSLFRYLLPACMPYSLFISMANVKMCSVLLFHLFIYLLHACLPYSIVSSMAHL